MGNGYNEHTMGVQVKLLAFDSGEGETDRCFVQLKGMLRLQQSRDRITQPAPTQTNLLSVSV